MVPDVVGRQSARDRGVHDKVHRFCLHDVAVCRLSKGGPDRGEARPGTRLLWTSGERLNLVSPTRLNELRFSQDPLPLAKLWRWCREGRLPARKIGGEWYVDLDAFDRGETGRASPPEGKAQAVLDRLRGM